MHSGWLLGHKLLKAVASYLRLAGLKGEVLPPPNAFCKLVFIVSLSGFACSSSLRSAYKAIFLYNLLADIEWR
jgi:hypothetical protein